MPKLLIVDDAEEQQIEICNQAKKAGYLDAEIEVVKSKSEAAPLIASQMFQVAVIDLCLAGGEDDDPSLGLEVIQVIRDRQPNCRIVGLTRYAYDSGVDVINSGADDFIYTGWPRIAWTELLKNKLALWRQARPRHYAIH
ncbi:MAG: response regulator [Isosphaeraceae bacterium]